MKNYTTFTKWIIGLSVNLIGNLDTLLLQLIGAYSRYELLSWHKSRPSPVDFDYLKAPVLELGPATAHMGCVLPDHLGVVADAPAALLARPETINIASLHSEFAEYKICK